MGVNSHQKIPLKMETLLIEPTTEVAAETVSTTGDDYAKKLDALIANIEAGNYHLSASSLLRFMQSPRQFIEYKLNKTDDQTPDMLLGSVTHMLALTPDLFDQEYVIPAADVVKPKSAAHAKFCGLLMALKPEEFEQVVADEEKRGKAILDFYTQCYSTEKKSVDKVLAEALTAYYELEKYMAFQRTVGKRKVITQEVKQSATAMADRLRQNTVTRRYIEQMQCFETKIEYEYCGIKFKGFLDAMSMDDMGIIVDLKKLKDASPQYVRRTVLYDGYDVQVQSYRLGTGLGHSLAAICAVEAGGDCSMNFLHQSVLANAQQKMDTALFYFRRCIIEGAWDASYDYFSNRVGEFAGTFLIS